MPQSDPYDRDQFVEALKDDTPGETEFHQAVHEVLDDIVDVTNDMDGARQLGLLERLTTPDRIIQFRVSWEDDEGQVHINNGYRVQFNNALGPYKGGLRFHPSVNISILKFLGFEQCFKNALTGLPMGGAKGGADFNPKGRSDREILRFCTSLMTELHRHIAPDVDVPAGDIGVGSREIGYLFGAYRRITNEHEGVLTGKGLTYGGSELRTEATGYGLIHFACHMLDHQNQSFDEKAVAISGAGNVATYAADHAIDMGARVVTLSDTSGTLYAKDGFSKDLIQEVRQIKSDGQSLQTLKDQSGLTWHEDSKPWGVACDIALPCATQNEMDEDHVAELANNGCRLIAEGANMPLTTKARHAVQSKDIRFGPAKAANAGGVAVSGLEISQNRARDPSPRDVVSKRLQDIMKNIHDKCVAHGKSNDGKINYARGANLAAYERLAAGMMAQGIA